MPKDHQICSEKKKYTSGLVDYLHNGFHLQSAEN